MKTAGKPGDSDLCFAAAINAARQHMRNKREKLLISESFF